jgi:preprotein translocase subunit SecD
MLYFSRWKAAAILGTTLIVCLAALTNVLPAATFDSLPGWAQRKIELGIDLRGGVHYQLIVDEKDVRRMMVEQLREDVRNALRSGRIGYTGLVLRDDGVELRVRDEADLSQALTRLRDIISLPVAAVGPGTSPVTVRLRPGEANVTADRNASAPAPVADMSVDDRRVRLTLTRAAIGERTVQARNQAINIIDRRLRFIVPEFSIRPVGPDRIVLDTATPDLLERLHSLSY